MQLYNEILFSGQLLVTTSCIQPPNKRHSFKCKPFRIRAHLPPHQYSSWSLYSGEPPASGTRHTREIFRPISVHYALMRVRFCRGRAIFHITPRGRTLEGRVIAGAFFSRVRAGIDDKLIRRDSLRDA